MVIQNTRPYVSSEDIAKGTFWGDSVRGELKGSQFGIVCVTRDNFEQPWINFELGALSNAIGLSAVCPLLIDLSEAEITGPMTLLQMATSTRDEVLKLVKSINEAGTDAPILDRDVLAEVFARFWPDLEASLKSARESTGGEQAPRKPDEMLAEVLETVRGIRRAQNDSNVLVTSRFPMFMPQLSGPTKMIPMESKLIGRRVSHQIWGDGTIERESIDIKGRSSISVRFPSDPKIYKFFDFDDPSLTFLPLDVPGSEVPLVE